MSLLDIFKNKISTDQERAENAARSKCPDDLIALGVLLWAVAEADEKFLPKEKEKIGEVLKLYSKISDNDMPIVIRAIEEASVQRIDLYEFAKDASKDIDRQCKIKIVEDLFRVACSDNDLNLKEHEVIRSISNLFGLDHKEFIEAKIKIKKEFGIETV